MDLLKTVEEFAGKDRAAERATFEAAMIKKLQEEPYKMSDLLYNVYRCQRDIDDIFSVLDKIITSCKLILEKLEEKPKPKPKAKRGK